MSFVDYSPALTDNEMLRSIWVALRRIEDALSVLPALAELPAPIVTVTPPDLTDIVTAVTGLKGPQLDAADIARAIADVLRPPGAGPQGNEALAEVARALSKLDHRLQGLGTQAYGGGTVNLASGQTIGVSNFPADQLVHATNLDLAITALRDAITKTGATAKTLADVVSALASVPVTGTFWQATQPISAASLPLPTSAATETTLGTRLSESDFDTKAGAVTEAAPATDTASSGHNGRLQRIAQRLTSLIALLPAALGQTTKTGSLSVAIASDQTVPVSGTFYQATQPVSGTFWQATQPVSGTFWQATQPVSGTFWQATQPVSAASLPLPTGAATETTLGLLPARSNLFKSRSDTFTATGNGTTVDSSAMALQSYGIQVKGTGAAATVWTVVLEGSLDNANFTTIVSHSNTDGDGVVKWSGANRSPCLYFRSRCSSLTLGSATNVVVTIVGDD